jgi:hypothetical protein
VEVKVPFAGGSCSVFAEEHGWQIWDILIGSSTGSLLIPHLALEKYRKFMTSIPMWIMYFHCHL